MHAEIVAVGTELTTGAKLDTNSQWLSLALAELGIPTHFHTTVADDLEEMTAVLRAAVNRSGLVLITGGIGPTLDDLTRHALANLVQKELLLDDDSLQHIESLFRRRNRSMPQRNRIQAMFPEGSDVIPNLRGTAPGIWMEVPRKGDSTPCLVAAMPGVPSEMKRMFESEVQPRLPGGKRVIQRARVNCFGIGESAAEEMLGELTARGRDPDVGITVHEATITLRITATGTSPADCAEKIGGTKSEIRRRMGSLVFGEEDEELEHAVMDLLARQGKTLATAESGTGGLLAYRISETEEFADCHRGGFVAGSEQDLCQLAANGQQTETASGGSRRQLAIRIADLTRSRFQTDFALAILDCPQFNPDESDGVSPMTFVAVSSDRATLVSQVSLFGDPAIQKSRTVKAALNLLRLKLQEAAPE